MLILVLVIFAIWLLAKGDPINKIAEQQARLLELEERREARLEAARASVPQTPIRSPWS